MRIRAASLLSCVAAACALAVPRVAGADGPAPFAPVAAAYLADAERGDPLFADGLGVRTYDDALPDWSARGLAARSRMLHDWHDRISAARADGLSAGDDADAVALQDTIDLAIFEDATVEPFATDPTLYTGALGGAVYALTGRRDEPLEARLRHLAPRLRAVPALVRAARENLDRPSRAATLQAIDEADGVVAMYAGLRAVAKPASPAVRASVAAALPPALASVRAFAAFLRGPLLARSTGGARVGAAVFDRELELADGTTEPREAIVAAAQADFDATRAAMLRLALPLDAALFPGALADETRSNAADVVVRRVLDRLAATAHPSRDGIFAAARGDVEGIRAFLHATPVITLPEPDTLSVVATPAFMAGFSGASLDPAGPFAPLAGSFYYIDRIPGAWTSAHVESYLRDYNDFELRMLSIHEAIPGHYVQFRIDDANASLVRRAFPSGSFAEGWATYGEGMMLDAGYGGGDPRLRLFQLKWRLREDANAIIDAAFHAGDLTEARCDDFLERQAFQERSEADGKWHRLQLSHDQLASYFVGRSAIERARDASRARDGAAWSLGAFNARLLALGSVEPRFVAPLLGDGAAPDRAAPPAPASPTP